MSETLDFMLTLLVVERVDDRAIAPGPLTEDLIQLVVAEGPRTTMNDSIIVLLLVSYELQ
jgi:hypothetical protein